MSYIGDNIKKLRKERRMTQEQLATRLGVSYQAVSKWENHMADPDVLLMPHIAEVFGITLDQVYDQKLKGYRNLAERLGAVYEANRTRENFNRGEAESRRLMESGEADDRDLRGRGILFEYEAYECAKEAEKLFQMILDKGKKDDVYYETQGQLAYHRFRMNRNDENIREYEYKVRQEPEDVQNYCMLMTSYLRAGRIDDAWRTTQEGMKRHQENAYFCHYTGNVLSMQGNSEEAIQFWRKSYELDTEILANLYGIVEEYEKLGLFEAAINVCREIKQWLNERGCDVEEAGMDEKISELSGRPGYHQNERQ